MTPYPCKVMKMRSWEGKKIAFFLCINNHTQYISRSTADLWYGSSLGEGNQEKTSEKAPLGGDDGEAEKYCLAQGQSGYPHKSLTLVHHHPCHYYHCSFILTTQAQWTWTVKMPTVLGRRRYQCWDANSVCDVFYLLNYWRKTTDSHFWRKIKFSVRSYSKSWQWSVGAPIRMCFGASLAQDSWFFFSVMLYRKVLEKVWVWVVAGKTQESIMVLSLPVHQSWGRILNLESLCFLIGKSRFLLYVRHFIPVLP